MLLKTADDKSKRIALLENLKQAPALDAFQRRWLREEHSRLRKGIQGERESAYYLDNHFKGSVSHVVLHDLRFVVDGDVAQIDHLVINRGVGMYLIETKNYAGSLLINAHGEFTADYDGDRFGIPSPIEQSRRHERVLTRLLDTLGICMRTGKGMQFHHVVLLHPKAIIARPPTKQFDTSMVIKADQFPSWHKNFVHKELGILDAFKAVANLRGVDTITAWGEKLLRQHRPVDLLELPDFMKPRELPTRQVAAPLPKPHPVVRSAPPEEQRAPVVAMAPPEGNTTRKLVCAHCGCKISFPEGKFCWNNSPRFGGLQYCREHQSLFQAG